MARTSPYFLAQLSRKSHRVRPQSPPKENEGDITPSESAGPPDLDPVAGPSGLVSLINVLNNFCLVCCTLVIVYLIFFSFLTTKGRDFPSDSSLSSELDPVAGPSGLVSLINGLDNFCLICYALFNV